MPDGIGVFAIGVSVVGGGTPAGYQQVVDMSTVVALAVPAGATVAIISVENAPARYRDDGEDPTRDVGMPIEPGLIVRYVGNLSALRFTEQSPSAILNVLYYGG